MCCTGCVASFTRQPLFSQVRDLSHSGRRHCLVQLAACGLTAWGLPAGAAAVNHPVLRVLAWPGYAEPEVVQEFERTQGAKVDVTVVDSDDALWQRATGNGASDFDVFAVNTAELQRYVAQGLVSPVAPGMVPNRRQQLARFQDVARIGGLVHGGRVMAVPFTYAEMGLIYDRQRIAQPPDSIGALWDTRHQGRVLAYNGGTHAFSLAAQALRLSSPFRLRPQDWPAVVDKLIALRRNVAAYYTQPDESLDLFRSRGAVLMLANYGSQQLQLFKGAGLDVGYAIPREGALAWLDCWAITRKARNPQLAAAWINHLLDRTASNLLVTRQGLSSTTAEPVHALSSDKLVWLEPPEDDERRNRLWQRIVSGDRAAKVLAT